MSRWPQPVTTLLHMTRTPNAKIPITIDLTTPVQTHVSDKPAALSTPDASKQPSLVELKAGKLVLKQRLLPLERMMTTLKEMVSFNEMLQSLISPLESIPEAHLPLVAKLAFESDKTVSALAKRMKGTLLPEMGMGSDEGEGGESEDSANLPLPVLEAAITSVGERVNYGVDDASAAMSLWRWEVKDFDMLPPEVREKANKRRADREQAKRDVVVLLDGLSEEERIKLLPNKEKAVARDLFKDAIARGVEKTPKSKEKENMTPEPTLKSLETPKTGQSTAESGKKTVIRPRKILDAEQLALAKEKQEKAAQKAEHKQKKGAEQAKAAATMTAWLGKGKGKSVIKAVATTSRLSSAKSDFDSNFKPFVVKKDVKLAPVNPFTPQKAKPKAEPIVLDSEGDIIMEDVRPLSAPKDLLFEFLAVVPSTRKTIRSTSTWRSAARYCVRDVMAQITEAEVIGDDRLVRQLRGRLTAGRNVPVKLLQFHDNVRPAYFGTWSKSSAAVGARAPFARDITTFDYSYDSGDDWNEEEEGGEDVMSDAGSATPELDSEEDDEFAGWMVDDDDVDEGEQPTSPPPDFDWPAPPPKRKPEAEKEQKTKRRKVVTPLIPYTKGPCFEETIGVCEHDAFHDYRIHFLNDAPFPLDPFAFVAPPMKPEGAASAAAGEQKIPPTGEQQPHPESSASATAAAESAAKSKGAVPPPKHPFPEQHLAALLQAIEGSTKPRPVLLEDLFSSFKHLGVKKNAIDAKLKEVCVKEKKVWKVLDEAWVCQRDSGQRQTLIVSQTSVGVGAPMTAA
ncbi:hypothetical protein CALCODRAFT_515915 [Calocera cornea HHB12733]|uniref:Chromatin assembly factor 1 subunit A dimerization domain-containing protein n=1 Tax=Calocera cornea HHB12733 TaxID=1353952 RepID=A0A165HW57_9BASI|nr:hypothetical protein CALCODRAFT_515915 [Calocera cornea HHB12733]